MNNDILQEITNSALNILASTSYGSIILCVGIIFIALYLYSYRKNASNESTEDNNQYESSQFLRLASGIGFIILGIMVIFTSKNSLQAFEDLGNLSEAFNAFLGVPAALGGSLIAIILADRAISITRKQEEFEKLQHLDKVIEEVVNIYSNIGYTYRKLLRANHNLTKAIKNNLDHNENSESAFIAAKESINDFHNVIDEFAWSILEVGKSHLANKAWEISLSKREAYSLINLIDKDNTKPSLNPIEENLNGGIADNPNPLPKLSKFIPTGTTNKLSDIALVLEQSIYQMSYKKIRDGYGQISNEKEHGIFRVLPNGGYTKYVKNVDLHNQGIELPFNDEDLSKAQLHKPNLIQLYNEMLRAENISKFLEDNINSNNSRDTLKLLGASILTSYISGYSYRQDKNSGFFYNCNLGMAALVDLLAAWPSTDDLRDAIFTCFLSNLNENPNLSKRVNQICAGIELRAFIPITHYQAAIKYQQDGIDSARLLQPFIF